MTFGIYITCTFYVIEYTASRFISFSIYDDFFSISIYFMSYQFPANHVLSIPVPYIRSCFYLVNQSMMTKLSLLFTFSGSISNIEDDQSYRCSDGSSPEIQNKVISGVVAAASSVTSIQVANLLKLFKIPQVIFIRNIK